MSKVTMMLLLLAAVLSLAQADWQASNFILLHPANESNYCLMQFQGGCDIKFTLTDAQFGVTQPVIYISVFVEPTVGAQPISQTSVVNTILLQNTQTISFPIRWPANGFYQLLIYDTSPSKNSSVLLSNTTFGVPWDYEVDRDALKDLYNHTQGPSWVNSSAWMLQTTPPIVSYCDWAGVSCYCNQTMCRVGKLYLDNRHLVGNFPPTFAHLTAMTHLSALGNSLSGTLPDCLSRLSSLMYLDLSGNQFVNALPDSLGDRTTLKFLYLYNNSFNGTVPQSWQGLSEMTWLDISYNQLSGSFPLPLLMQTKLVWLSVSHNLLTGTLPTDLGNCLSLTSLLFNANYFWGPFPSSLFNLQKLNVLAMASHEILRPATLMFSYFPVLQTYYVDTNQLSTTIPSALQMDMISTQTLIYVNNNNILLGTVPMKLLQY